MAESKPRCSTKPGWFMKALTCFTAATGAGGKASTDSALNVHELAPSIQNELTSSNETILPNGVTVYGDSHAVETFASVVNEFPEVWKDTGKFADVPESEWMTIPLRSDWESCIRPKVPKVYPALILIPEVSIRNRF
jgi:hypothetical protein